MHEVLNDAGILESISEPYVCCYTPLPWVSLPWASQVTLG